MLAIGSIRDGVPIKHPYSCLVTQVRCPLDRDWDVRLFHVFIECNRVANFLIGFAYSCPLGVHLLITPPTRCGGLLLDNLVGALLMQSAAY